METLKHRTESKELKVMRFLNLRLKLDFDTKKYYYNLEKGYEGEKNCDALLETNVTGGKLILHDLLLEVNNTIFQIDTLIISQENNYPLELKNYEGNHFYIAPEFYKNSEKIIKNPLDQLKRNESLLRQLFLQLGFNFPIKGYVIFINPHFTLYQAPVYQPIFYPTQLDQLIRLLNTKSSLTEEHYKLAEKLLALHLKVSPYSKVPKYEYTDLRKGIVCSKCQSFNVLIDRQKLVCTKCGCIEGVEAAVMRNVEEIKLLFPNRKITTNGV